jgi:hypothetical protein
MSRTSTEKREGAQNNDNKKKKKSKQTIEGPANGAVLAARLAALDANGALVGQNIGGVGDKPNTLQLRAATI